MIKALGMRKRALKHEWLWVVRWVLLFLVGSSFLYASIKLILGFKNEAGFMIGVFAGIFLLAGINWLISLVDYAIRRIRLGRKVRRFYEKVLFAFGCLGKWYNPLKRLRGYLCLLKFCLFGLHSVLYISKNTSERLSKHYSLTRFLGEGGRL